jgi:plasmid stabilization system protein ParE
VTSSVVFTPEAEKHLADLYRYIAAARSPEAAARYTDSIVTFCEKLAMFPHRGRARDE